MGRDPIGVALVVAGIICISYGLAALLRSEPDTRPEVEREETPGH